MAFIQKSIGAPWRAGVGYGMSPLSDAAGVTCPGAWVRGHTWGERGVQSRGGVRAPGGNGGTKVVGMWELSWGQEFVGRRVGQVTPTLGTPNASWRMRGDMQGSYRDRKSKGWRKRGGPHGPVPLAQAETRLGPHTKALVPSGGRSPVTARPGARVYVWEHQGLVSTNRLPERDAETQGGATKRGGRGRERGGVTCWKRVGRWV